MYTPYALNLFPNSDDPQNFESLSGEAFLRASARMVLKYLWQNWSEDAWPESVFDSAFYQRLQENHSSLATFFSALLTKRNPFLTKAVRIETQVALMNLLARLQESPPQDPMQHLSVQLAIHNMLSIYVMFSPTPHENITIPQLINNSWQSVTFNPRPIEVTPTTGPWVSFLGDQDRLFAYGFEPIDNDLANSILMHCGTGWPTAQGSTIQILADIWPHKTPGEVFFEWQHQAISEWLDNQTGKVITAGQSLGGACAYLTAMHRPDKISQAYCLVPPGLVNYDISSHALFGAWSKHPTEEKPNVFIQKQKDDPVSQFGTFPEDFTLVNCKLLNEGNYSLAMSLFSAHARSFITCDAHHLSIGNMAKENAKQHRQQQTKLLYDRARPWFFYLLLMPYFIFIKPMRPWLQRNALMLFLTTSLLIGFISYPLTPLFGSALLGAVTCAYTCSYLICTLLKMSKLPTYFKQLHNQALKDAIYTLSIDILNLATFGLLEFFLNFSKLLFIKLPNIFSAQQPPEASIHTKEMHSQTQNLDDHPTPDFYERLQATVIVISFYAIAWPLKTIFYDLPQAISSLVKRLFSSSAASTSKPEPSESHHMPEVDVDIEINTQHAQSKAPCSSNMTSWFCLFSHKEEGELASAETYKSANPARNTCA